MKGEQVVLIKRVEYRSGFLRCIAEIGTSATVEEVSKCIPKNVLLSITDPSTGRKDMFWVTPDTWASPFARPRFEPPPEVRRD